MMWFSLVLWHINHCRLFHTKSSLYVYIKHLGFGLVGFYDISNIFICDFMTNPIYTYILNIYDLVWFGFITYQPLLFNAKSSLYIYVHESIVESTNSSTSNN